MKNKKQRKLDFLLLLNKSYHDFIKIKNTDLCFSYILYSINGTYEFHSPTEIKQLILKIKNS